MNKLYPPPAIRSILILILLLVSHLLTAQMITTIAGGSIGEGQPATSIGMTVYGHQPTMNKMAVDAAENVYIADNNTNRIRKISAATGIITTFAGNGNTNASGDGGPAINAGLGTVLFITFDRLGNMYLGTGGRIRKIDAATGIINTIAGTGIGGFSGDSGLATLAQVSAVRSVTVDTAGNIYFTNLQRIRKITAATGIITTIAGGDTSGYRGDGGPASQALLAAPRSITSDGAGNLYWFDNNNNAVRKITAATGIITTIVGSGLAVSGFSGDGGPASAARISWPTQVVADEAGNLYLSDNNRVRMINAVTGIINTIYGTGYGGYTPDGVNALMAMFGSTGDLAISRSGNLYLHDENNYLIRKIAAGTNLLSTVYGNRTKGNSNLPGSVSNAQLFVSQLAIDQHNHIYFSNNYRIYRIDTATNMISVVAGTGYSNGNAGSNHGEGGPATAANITPGAMEFDSTGNLYFIDAGKRVRKITMATGIVSTIAGTDAFGYTGDGGPATAATFYPAMDLAFDRAGNLYIADGWNHVVRKISATTGIITTIAGSGAQGYSGDGGLATAAALNNVYGITLDRSNNLYISDYVNNAIRRVDAKTGIITTVAGTGATGYNGDGIPATSAKLFYPNGIVTDTAGNVYFADEFNNRVRKITMSTGIITTVAGLSYGGYNGDNIPASTAALKQPSCVRMDTAGNLYIADNTYRIRKITFDTVKVVPPVGNPLQPADTNTVDSAVIVTKAYPNPAHGNVTIALQGLISGHIAVTVTDVYGKPIATQQVSIQPTTNYTVTMPLPTSLPKGFYYVRIYVNNEKQVHTLMIE